LHELESDFFERRFRFCKVHRALDVVALLEAVQRLLRVNLEKKKTKKTLFLKQTKIMS
jgi:hypothetical protein